MSQHPTQRIMENVDSHQRMYPGQRLVFAAELKEDDAGSASMKAFENIRLQIWRRKKPR